MKIKMKRLFGILLSLVLVLGLMPGMSMIAQASTEETLLTTVTYTNGGSQTHSPEGVVTVTLNGVTINDNIYGWLFYDSGTVTVAPVDGVEITKVRFRQNGKNPVDDDLAPFTLTFNEGEGSVETSTGTVYAGIMDGVTSIEVYRSETIEEYTVTYKVVNGSWSDGTTVAKTETVEEGANPTNVPTGMVAATGYTGGSWDTAPSTATISADTTFTYTFVADSSSTSPDDGDNNPSSGSSDNNSSNNDSSNNNNSSNDSGNSNSEPKAETPYDYLEPLRGELKAEIALGGERTVTWNQGTALPYDIMKTLQDNPGVTLIFSYTYQGIDYKVTISGRDAKAYTEIPWYGPLYLYKHYGSSSETAPADTADTAIGTRTYTVIPGDTLSEIATKLNTTVESLVSLNDIKNRDFILVGQILKY